VPEVVDAWTEADVAVLLGVSPEQAVEVVRLLAGRDLLHHGVAVIGAAAAARWGIPATEALRDLAEGRSLHGSFSHYELRAGREEAESDVEDVWEPEAITLGERWGVLGLERTMVVASPHHLGLPGGLGGTA
jgi:hypothetical protein